MIHEVTHSAFKSNRDGMLLKLDISKVYDRVDWSLLIQVMCKFRFRKDWLALIKECVSTTTFSILINGGAAGYIVGKRGLHQGDPLYPFLFIFMVEALWRSIQKATLLGKIESIEPTKDLLPTYYQ